MTTRVDWTGLSEHVRSAVEARTGPIHQAWTVKGGHNSEIALRLDTATGPVFLKGLRDDHPRSWTQYREAAVSAHTAGLVPPFLWHLETGGWNLLAFTFLEARHADYTHGSPDLASLGRALADLAALPAPPPWIDLKRAEERWAPYLHDTAALSALAGPHLCHTDFNPENVLITSGRAHLVDWAWSTRGAPWIDAALAPIWLIATGGQHPSRAARWAARHPAWHTAPTNALTTFAEGNARLWHEINAHNPAPWATRLHHAARRWAAFLNRTDRA